MIDITWTASLRRNLRTLTRSASEVSERNITRPVRHRGPSSPRLRFGLVCGTPIWRRPFTMRRSTWIGPGFMVFVCLATSMFPAVGLAAEKTGWQAGVAKVKITPTELMPMAGYASRGGRPAESKLTDLWAKALVLQDAAGHRAVLVTLDLIGIDRTLSRKIVARLQKTHSLKRAQIALCTSHTHTGPVVAGNLRPLHYALLSQPQQRPVDR